MKKYLLMFVALLAVVALAAPSFAVELKYGGMMRTRLQSNDNISDGNDDIDDNGNWIDQRLRVYFTFQSSENLQVVTKWEFDTLWGDEGSSGDVGADDNIFELKNAYLDFAIPSTPARAYLGVQGIELLKGWIISDDFSAAVVKAPFKPFSVSLGYIAAQNEDVESTQDNIDVAYLSVDYAEGHIKAGLIGYYQYGHDTAVSVNPGLLFNAIPDNDDFIGDAEDNHFFDLGAYFEYKESLWSAYVNFVKNFGGVEDFDTDIDSDGDGEDDEVDIDFEGWMVEAGASLYCGPFTFSIGGFATSGDDLVEDVLDGDADDSSADGFFRYPTGVSHYWSEIMGLGTLDVNVGGPGPSDRVQFEAGYASADHPSNLWMVNVGAAWQALEDTKLTLNYYYIGTMNDVLADLDGDTDNAIGHELDFYLDQRVVDKLSLRLVGAYLFAEDGYTVFDDDDDAYEVGAQLLWSF